MVAALTAWWCAVTGQPTDAFTATRPGEQIATARAAWDDED